MSCETGSWFGEKWARGRVKMSRLLTELPDNNKHNRQYLDTVMWVC